MDLNITNESIKDLSEIEDDDLYTFPSEFVSKLTGNISRCLDIDEKPFQIRSGDSYDIVFSEPAYVESVLIKFTQSVSGSTVQVFAFDVILDKKIKFKNSELSSNSLLFRIKKTTSGVSILLEPNIWELFGRKTLKIEKITIKGYLLDDFCLLSDKLDLISGLRSEAIKEISHEKNLLISNKESLDEREKSILGLEEKINQEVSDLKVDLGELKSSINVKEEKLSSIMDSISRMETRKKDISDQMSSLETNVRNIDGEILQKKTILKNTSVDIEESIQKLRKLTSNINLIPEEFSSFSNHGNKQINIFIALSVIPLVIVFGLTVQLLYGAVDLSVKYVNEPNIDLLTVFITRVPYLIVSGSILTVCYAILRLLLTRISHIYAERLDFSKIGIIAKDVASASTNNLQLSDQDIYESRTYLKIEMLKSYLGGNVGAYTYSKRENEEDSESKEKKQNEEESIEANSL